MNTLAFARDNARWLAAGFLMALGSSFGQTFFIALFSDPLRATFGLSHGGFGTIYMLATLASALTIIQLGRLADRVDPRPLACCTVLALAAVCLAMAGVAHWLMLLVLIYGLRLLGQGMLSHISQTVMARSFDATRGRALAIASFGYPTGEALAPLIAIAVIAALGWREAWGLAAGALALGLAPALWVLLSRERQPSGRTVREGTGATGVQPLAVATPAGMDARQWERREVIRHPVFWLLIPGIMAPGFMLTVLFFLPAHIAEIKGWDFAELPQRYWVYAATSVLASLVFGMLIDRFNARACLPYYLLPMAAGLLVLASATTPGAITVVMGLVGLTAGAAVTIHSALWAELYGTRHLGAIKALAHAVMVFSTAAGPGLAGVLIDAGVAFDRQAVWFAAYTFAISVLFAVLIWRGNLGTQPGASEAMMERQ